MEKRLTMILASLFLCVGMALAQTTVTGTVVSQEDGLPIIGATVRVDGTDTGTVTDADGRFSLSLPSGKKKLVVSYVGMETQEVTVRGRNVNVTLLPVLTDLEEVMVVAYGTSTKSAFTGSAAVVKSEEISKISNSNVLDALSGKVSGVQINSATGAPGQSDFTIKVRGISSINADTEPLIVVDGAPYPGDINNLNPNDIASMTVLKDAASAALYGARGANGVVLITTKNGREGTSSITVDAKWGANTRGTQFYNTVQSPAAYYEAYYLALKNYGIDNAGRTGVTDAASAHRYAMDNLFGSSMGLGYNVYNVPAGQELIGPDGKLNPNATMGNIVTGADGSRYMLRADDWRDAIYQTGLRQEYNLTATASNDKGSFYASIGYLDNEGISKNSEYERITGRLKADYQLRSWLKIGGNVDFAHYTANALSDDGGSTVGNIFNLAYIAPIFPLYVRDEAGNILQDTKTGLPMYDWGDGSVTGITRPYQTGSNAIFSNLYDKNETDGNSFNANGYAEIRFLKDFKFTTNNTMMLDETRFTYTNNPFYGQFASTNGTVQKNHVRQWTYNLQQLLNWHHQYGKHDVEVMLGHEYYREHYYTLSGSKTNLFGVFNDELAGAVTNGSMDSYTTDYNVEGYFGRAQYNYDQKYFASLSYRRDASSRFAPEHRWGNFWSFGGAWLISKESWFNAPWVDELKFKASYGEQGNDNIGNYLYTDTYSIVPAGDIAGLTPSSVKGNREITWEKNGNFNTGFEFSFFRGKLAGSAEFFYRRTTDMLAYYSLPVSSGYSGYYDNVGNMENLGVEVELNGTFIRTKDFEWGANINFTAYKNEVTSIAEDNKNLVINGSGGYTSGNYFYGEGHSLYTFYLPKYAGVDENGKALFYQDITEKVFDEQGNPVYDKNGQQKTKVVGRTTTTNYSATEDGSDPGATYYLCGTALPWAYGGFGTHFAYKGFDFSIDFNYQIGGQIYDSDYAGMMALSSTGRGTAIHADLLKAWSEDNKGSNIPRLVLDDTNANATSDRFLVDASYLSLSNLNFGYTFPSKWTAKAGISKLRLYLTATNLWLWSQRQGLDPRQSITGGASTAYYSAMRTISGGITVTF